MEQANMSYNVLNRIECTALIAWTGCNALEFAGMSWDGLEWGKMGWNQVEWAEMGFKGLE